MNLRKLIAKLKYCNSPSSLIHLEDQFNAIGLTVQLSNGRLFLCTINDGRPAHERLFEDHIPLYHYNEVLDANIKHKILSFTLEHIHKPTSVVHPDKSNAWFYGDSIMQQRRAAESDIISAIAEWLDDKV